MKTVGVLLTVGLLVMGGIAAWRFVDRTADALGPANIRTLVFVVVLGVLFIAALAASSLPIRAARWQPDRPEKYFYHTRESKVFDGRVPAAPQVHFLPNGANALWPDQVVNAVNQRAYQIGQADRLLLGEEDSGAPGMAGAVFSLAELDAAGDYADW